MDIYPRTSPFLKSIPNNILATKNNLESVSSLIPMKRIGYQLLVLIFQLLEDALEILTYVNKHLIFFILSRTGVNLPLIIFNFLRKKIIASHEVMSSLIPFWKSYFWTLPSTSYCWECVGGWINWDPGDSLESEARISLGPSSVGLFPL